jgi:phosphoribosylglycinamide formyltransferase 1
MTQPREQGGERLPIAILISGRGSNMSTIAERAAAHALPVVVRVVISDQPAAPGLQSAAAMQLPTRVLSPREFADKAAYERALAELIIEHGAKLVVLAGFMRILSAQFIAAFSGRILNVHPSLLPKYRGLHTHRRVLEAGDQVHGVSIHFVTEELDGGPVIVQSRVPVRSGDTEATLSARVQRHEHRIYPLAIDWFARGRLVLRDNCAWLDGKRLETPVLVEPDAAIGG